MAIDSIRSTPVDDKAAPRSTAPVAPSAAKSIYTCPMHPEVQQDHPGDCPKCGMTLELKTVTAGTDDEENAELRDMTRRFWIGAAPGVAGVCPGDGSLDPGTGQATLGGWQRLTLDAICARHTRGRVGRLAVIAPRLAFRRDASLEHVHADRHWRGRGIRLERRGDAHARHIPRHDATRGQGCHLL